MNQFWGTPKLSLFNMLRDLTFPSKGFTFLLPYINFGDFQSKKLRN